MVNDAIGTCFGSHDFANDSYTYSVSITLPCTLTYLRITALVLQAARHLLNTEHGKQW